MRVSSYGIDKAVPSLVHVGKWKPPVGLARVSTPELYAAP